MSRFDALIGMEPTRGATLDVDLIREEAVIVPGDGREIRLSRAQAHTLALGLIKSVDLIDKHRIARG